jgi:hypothetical protein
VLRGLDYLRSAGAKPDERTAEATLLVEKNRGADGRWPLQNPHGDVPDFRHGSRRSARPLEPLACAARADLGRSW